MATYRGRSFSASCDECGDVFTATHISKAEAQAAACYEKHYPPQTRDLKVALDDAWESFGGRDE